MRCILCLLAGSLALFGANVEALSTPAERKAKAAEKAGDVLKAYLYYAQAAARNPRNYDFWMRSQALQRRALATAQAQAVAARAAAPPELIPEPPPLDPVTPEDLTEAKQLQPPLRLQPQAVRKSFKFRGEARKLIEQVLKAYGLDVVFDGDYQSLQNIRFELTEADFPEAQAALQGATASFLVPVNEKIALVARDTQQKRQELEHTLAVAIPLPAPVSLQEAQEMARVVQQLFEIMKFGVDSTRRVAVVRDRASKVIPAVAMFEELLRYKTEIMFDVEFLEVTRSKARTLGIQWQTSTTFAFLGQNSWFRPVKPTGFTNFLTFGGGLTLAGIGISGSQLFAQMSESDAQTLYRAQIRSTEGAPANFHLGDKYPVMTVGYFGQTTGTGKVYTPPPTFNFEDLGVVLKITPHAQENGTVAMEVEAEYKVLSGQTLNGIPVISNRKFTSSVRCQDGEAAVVAGLLRVNEARTLTGLAGLADIPALGALFRQQVTSTDTGEVLLLIRPHILSIPPHESGTRTLYTGTETHPRIPL